MLRTIRLTLAIVFFAIITLLFLDFSGTLHGYMGWMAKIQIKSETRHELSFFPNSFDDYVPKDSKVRMVDRIVRSMDINPLCCLLAHNHRKS